MNRRPLGAWIIAAAALALPANADIMYWYWQVEVNGQTADASKPIVVGAGDEVEIELWAEWEPQGDGFAWSEFSISVGDQFFQVASSVDISEVNGFGRNPSLSVYSDANGDLTDTDNSDVYDLIDGIDVLQLSRHFGLFDDSHPIQVYSLAWIIDQSINAPIHLMRTDIFANARPRAQQIYIDEWGNIADYDHVEDLLIFVPNLSTAMPLLYLLLKRRKRS